MRLAFVVLPALLAGCSFRPLPYVEGTVTRLEAPATATAGIPMRIRAHATFGDRYSAPLLNVHLPLEGTGAIDVEAVAAWLLLVAVLVGCAPAPGQGATTSLTLTNHATGASKTFTLGPTGGTVTLEAANLPDYDASIALQTFDTEATASPQSWRPRPWPSC